ncbi:MAG: DUF493 domain-containing protein [bacterium]|nr:DUF493 domain-containing protein [bacterium]
MTEDIKPGKLKTDIQNEHLWEFPVQYPLKIMGEARFPMRETIASIIHRHVPGFDHGTLTERPSSGGKYVSITVSVYIERKEQINALYADFAAHEHIKMVL